MAKLTNLCGAGVSPSIVTNTIDMQIKNIYLVHFLITVLIITGINCDRTQPEPFVQVPQNNLLADTITYDVLIANPNPEDTWTAECLGNLNRDLFIDQIFEGIYNGTLKPYDYYEEKPLKPNKIRRLEEKEELIRKNIGKVQFTERWYYDASELKMKKEVISMVLGEQLYNSDGEVRGYKPVFKVHLK